jgi:hypothetical protein
VGKWSRKRGFLRVRQEKVVSHEPRTTDRVPCKHGFAHEARSGDDGNRVFMENHTRTRTVQMPHTIENVIK